MFHSRKNVFWQALLSAALVFGIGLLLGVAFEQSRNNNVENLLLKSEINILDSQLIRTVGNDFNISCELGEVKIVEFADDIFEEARQLEKYEASNQLTDVLEILHKKYDLLRLVLWQQAIDLKDSCPTKYHTIVYFYQFKDPDLGLKSEQIAFSRALGELKEKYGGQIILIPIAGDLGLNSVDLVKSSYDIKDYPVVIFDESEVIYTIEDLNSLEDRIE